MTTIASRKAKGRRLQQWVRDKLLTLINSDLTDDDVRSTSMGASGLDILLSSKAKELIPFDIECKNKESLKGLYTDYNQAAVNSSNPYRIPLLVIKSNGNRPLAVLDFEDLIHFYGELLDNSPSNS